MRTAARCSVPCGPLRAPLESWTSMSGPLVGELTCVGPAPEASMTDDLFRGAWSPRPTNGPSLPGQSLAVDVEHNTLANSHEEGGDRNVDLTGTLTTWLRELAQRFKGGDHPDRVVG